MQSNSKITFFAEGLPKGQPRPKAFSRGGHASVYDPGTAEGWKACVAMAAKPHIEARITGPVRLTLSFRFPRPKSHFGKKQGHPILKESAPDFHTSKPDSDNLAKAIMDALSQIGIWNDDAQVASLQSTKLYAVGRIGCWIEIEQLTNSNASALA